MDDTRSYKYGACLSFAGEDRHLAEELAAGLVHNGLSVFYDRFEQTNLWGKNLYQSLHVVYSQLSRYCIIFVSKDYLQKAWTKHELKAAQARAFAEKEEYILPIIIDGTPLPWDSSMTAYLSLRDADMSEVISIAVEKISTKSSPKSLAEHEVIDRLSVGMMMEELAKEEDDTKALRKALLLMILLTQEQVREPTASFYQYLLTSFGPLDKHFVKHKHHLFNRFDTLRAILGDGKVGLTMCFEDWQELFEQLDKKEA